MQTVYAMISEILKREGGFVEHPDDAGGATKYGITERTARRHGWTGEMRDLPEAEAREIYGQEYWRGPGLDLVAEVSERIAAELLDTGVNMGPLTAIMFFKRALGALSAGPIERGGKGGERTLATLEGFLAKRGKEGERVLLVALNCLQGERYIELAEKREQNRSFLYGWLARRVEI